MHTPLPMMRDGLHSAGDAIATGVEDLGHQAGDLAIDAARQVRDRAQHARDATTDFLRHRPVAALMLAAAGGAAMVLVAGWLVRGSARRS